VAQTLVFNDIDVELTIDTSTGTNDLLVTGVEGQRVVAALRQLKINIPTLRNVVWDIPGGGIVGRLGVWVDGTPRILYLNFSDLTLPSPNFHYEFINGSWTEQEVGFLDEIKDALLAFNATHVLTSAFASYVVPNTFAFMTNYWRLEETPPGPWLDSVGSAPLSYVMPFPVPTQVAGKNNFGLQMPLGSISIIRTAVTFDWSGSYSWSFWYNPDAGPSRACFDNADASVYFGWDTGTSNFGIGINSGSPIEYTGTQIAVAGVYHFVVFTCDGATFKVYVNGVLDITAPEFPANTAGAVQMYNGRFDEIGRFSMPLSPAQITALYNAGAGKFF
jgi:hypothetical protein